MSLYYEDDAVTLYHGDCLTEHREWLAAEVLVTDPPYGMAYESGWVKGPRSIAGDGTTEVRDAALAAWGERPAIAFGRWNVPRPAAVRARLIQEVLDLGGLQ